MIILIVISSPMSLRGGAKGWWGGCRTGLDEAAAIRPELRLRRGGLASVNRDRPRSPTREGVIGGTVYASTGWMCASREGSAMSGLRVGDFVRFASCSAFGCNTMPEGGKAIFIHFEVMAEYLRRWRRALLHGGLAMQRCHTPLSPKVPLCAASGGRLHGGVVPCSTALPSRSAGSTLSLWGRAHLPVLSLCTAGRQGGAA